MGKMIELFQTDRGKRLLEALVLGLVASLIAALVITGIDKKRDAQLLVEREAIIVGVLLNESNIADDEIGELLMGFDYDEYYKSGADYIADYGYQLNTKPGYVLNDGDYSDPLLLTLLIVIAVMIPVAFILPLFLDTLDDTRILNDAAYCALNDGSPYAVPNLKGTELATLGKTLENTFHRLETLEDKLRERKKYMQDLISDISHQLKTPIAVIRLNNDLVSECERPRDEQQKLFAATDSQLTRMEWLIHEQLRLARLEAGSIVYNEQVIRLKPLFDEVFERFRLQAESNGTELVNEVDEDVCWQLDRNWIYEAFSNLISNSLGNTSNGQITVSACVTPLWLMVKIEDSGNGIPADKLPELFKRFNSQSGSVNQPGTGIGMSIANKIIEDAGGRVSVRSTVGVGTSFSIDFLSKSCAVHKDS